jgi:hypothetical protein
MHVCLAPGLPCDRSVFICLGDCLADVCRSVGLFCVSLCLCVDAGMSTSLNNAGVLNNLLILEPRKPAIWDLIHFCIYTYCCSIKGNVAIVFTLVLCYSLLSAFDAAVYFLLRQFIVLSDLSCCLLSIYLLVPACLSMQLRFNSMADFILDEKLGRLVVEL